MYQETLHIPLIVKFPYKVKDKEVSKYTSLVDIMPTILDYIGAYEPSGMSGESLIPALEVAAEGDIPDSEKYIYFDTTAFDPDCQSSYM